MTARTETPFAMALRKARYGHRDWIVWRDRERREHAERRSVAAIKAALLASGTRGHFTLVSASTATLMRIGWRHGITLLANTRRGVL